VTWRATFGRPSFLERPWKDTFLGIGTGDDVPRILRFTGKIRNRALTKVQCETRVKAHGSLRASTPPTLHLLLLLRAYV